MENYEENLMRAAREQVHANFYAVHLSSPLVEASPLPSLSKEDEKSDNFTIRLKSWVRNELSEIAEQEGVSMTQLINNAIVNAIIKHHDQKEARQIYMESMNKWKSEAPQFSKSLQTSELSRTSNPQNSPIGEILLKLKEDSK